MGNKWQIKWYDTLESTNEEAQRLLDGGDNMSVIAAFEQTSGKGQGDHKWHSAPGENLTFSIVLRYNDAAFPANGQKQVSDAVALAMTDYLAGKGIDAWIKLPNDIYVGDKKICGLLIRHKVRASFLVGSVIGIGVNINEKSFPEDLPNPISLSVLTGVSYDIHKELETLLGCLQERLDKEFGEKISSL